MKLSKALVAALLGNIVTTQAEQTTTIDGLVLVEECPVMSSVCAPGDKPNQGYNDLILNQCNLRMNFPSSCTIISVPTVVEDKCNFVAACHKEDHNGKWLVRNEVSAPINTRLSEVKNNNGDLSNPAKGFKAICPSWEHLGKDHYYADLGFAAGMGVMLGFVMGGVLEKAAAEERNQQKLRQNRV